MARTKKLLKTCITCAILCIALPCLALEQYYEEQYSQPIKESRNANTEEEEEGGGLPWWGWAIIIWIGLGWFADNDDETQSTESQPRRTTRSASSSNPYVIDPSR